MTTADAIFDQVFADPPSALRAGKLWLAEADDGQHADRSKVLRALSLAARHTNQIEDSIEFARSAADEGAAAADEKLRLLGLLTMSGSLAISGRIPEALRLIEDTIPTAGDDELRARFQFQRGAVLQDLGRAGEAVVAFETVLPEFERLGDQSAVGWTLNNLGRNLTDLGCLEEANGYLLESLRLATELGETAEIHGIEHNLGRLAAYQGEIPDALRWLQRSDRHYMEVSGASAPQHVARCEVLNSVGLYAEAQDLAERIARSNLESGDVEHAANAFIVAAEAALLRGEVSRALRLADEALILVGEASDSDRRVAAAKRIGHEARLVTEGPSRPLLNEVVDLAAEMESVGQGVIAGHQRLMAGRIAAALGDEAAAVESLEAVAGLRSGPPETRLQARLATALLRLHAGDRRGAARAARAGLDVLDRYQSALGASDLRLGIERHGHELAAIGLGLALQSRRSRRILDWLERTRARSLRYQPVIPSGDDRVMVVLRELRRVEADLRRDSHRVDPALLRRRRALQENIAEADRTRRETMVSGTRFSVEELIDRLGERTLLEIGAHDGQLFAIVVRAGRVSYVGLGESEAVHSELRHVRFAMRRAASRGRPLESTTMNRLDRLLFSSLDVRDGPVVVIPPPSLMSVPWAGLPRLRGGSLVLSPSAELWWRGDGVRSSGSSALVAGGPDLAVAGREVDRIAALYKGSTVFPPGATVEQVKAGMNGAAVAHVACHATFSVENPMFSSLRLGDGDLNIYDIERLDRSPSLVVLSACDSGYTEARAGDELAGLTSALLSMGTRTVVASVGLVPDSPATSDLMVDFHKGLVAGLEPAAALAAAQGRAFEDPERFISAASFVCIGA